jgi:hypothetical protein
MTETLTRPASLSPRDKFSPDKCWWVYLADLRTKTASLYRCETEIEAVAMQTRMEAGLLAASVAGKTWWRMNEWNARRLMGVRTWTVVEVVQ